MAFLIIFGIYKFSHYESNNSTLVRARVFSDAKSIKNTGQPSVEIYKIKEKYAELVIDNVRSSLGEATYFITYPVSFHKNGVIKTRRFVVYFLSDLDKKYESTVESMTFDVTDGHPSEGCYQVTSEQKCFNEFDNNFNTFEPISVPPFMIDSTPYSPLFGKSNFYLDLVVKMHGGLYFTISGSIIDHVQSFDY